MPQCQSTNVYYRVYVQINTTVKNERDNWFAFVLKLSFSSSGSLHSMPLFNNKKILSLLANRENIFSLTLRKSKNIDSWLNCMITSGIGFVPVTVCLASQVFQPKSPTINNDFISCKVRQTYFETQTVFKNFDLLKLSPGRIDEYNFKDL